MFFVALENVRSLHNIGAIFRTCSFFGVCDVLLVGYSGRDYDVSGKSVLHEQIEKTALGTQAHLNISFLDSSDALVDFVAERGFELIAVEQALSAVSLPTWKPAANQVVVFGNEVEGVSAQVLEATAKIVEIPRMGTHNSLNITTACGIVLYHAIITAQSARGPIV